VTPNNRNNRIEVPGQISYLFQPFRGAVLFTNGPKGEYARQAGIPHLISNELAVAMGNAEEAYHKLHGVRVVGPMQVDGVPYPLIVAQEKGFAAEGVMNKRYLFDKGAGVVTDAVFALEDPNNNISCTLHKPKTKNEQEELIRLLISAFLSGSVNLSTTTGICRFEYGPGELLPPEYYIIQTKLGTIKQPLDHAKLLNHIFSNGGKTAAGLTVPLALELLVKPQHEVPIDIFRFGPDLRQVIERTRIKIPGYNTDVLHFIALGLIK